MDRQTAPAKAGHCFQWPIPPHKRRTAVHQLTNTDDALGPQGVLTRQQQALPDQFFQPGTCFLCNPKLSWHRLECNFGRTCMAGGLGLSSLQELTLSEKHPAWMKKLSVTKNLLLCHTVNKVPSQLGCICLAHSYRLLSEPVRFSSITSQPVSVADKIPSHNSTFSIKNLAPEGSE